MQQTLKSKWQSPTRTENVLALCDSACSHSLFPEKLAANLHVQCTTTKLTVHGIISQFVVETHLVQRKLIRLHFSDTDSSTSDFKRFLRKQLKVGTDFNDVGGEKQKYPHLEPNPLERYTYENVEMFPSQDIFHVIRPLEYFKTDQTGTLFAVPLPLY